MSAHDDKQPTRDLAADERDRVADDRDLSADRREELAEDREQAADAREKNLDDLADTVHASQPDYDASSARWDQHQLLDRTEDGLERSFQGVDRKRARLSRDEAGDTRARDEAERQTGFPEGEHG